ncbi:thioesterase family protein [Bosea sp. ASV33]|uniref:thioesterase family protein n=1 Tax=Bosea sp. ASV33 TaxID=2795106 RepID=UPI0018EC7AAC|nr:thioesterase family protein [Bosea sp. ASV33]
MDIAQLGIPTHHTRVERWQCDFNDHWNARFYGRGFQSAAETVATLDGKPNPGAAVIAERHIRYHRELRVGAAVEVRSAVIRGGTADGAVAHLLVSAGRLSAVAIDRKAQGAHILPDAAGEDLERLLPRDLSSPASGGGDAGSVFHGEVGPVRPAELDHAGGLLFEEIIARTAITSHNLLLGLGYTMEFTERTGIGRMAIELSVARHGDVAAGAILVTHARLSHVGEKSFSLEHWLGTRAGFQVAAVRQTLLAVDLRTRRVAAVPDFLRRSG